MGKHQFLKLHKTEQECIMKLYNAHPEGSLDAYNAILCNTKKDDAQLKEWIGIWLTNSFFSVTDNSSCLYVKKSRFNHSCMPNVKRHCVEETENERNYTPPTIKNVKEDLKANWNFECNCELCGMTDKEKRNKIEKARVEYWNLREQVDLPNKIKPEERIKLCDDLIKLMKIGNIFYPSELAPISKIGFYCALICGQQKKASFYIQHRYESQLNTFGADDSITKYLRLMKSMMQDRRFFAMQNMSSSSVFLEIFPEVEKYL